MSETVRERFKKLSSYGLMKQDEEKTVEQLVNRLIENLYKPCDDERIKDGIDFVADGKKLKQFNLNGDAINWGDLGVVEVKPFKDGEFLVVIEEAAPDCNNLISYIERFMKLWGWKVRVQTEW